MLYFYHFFYLVIKLFFCLRVKFMKSDITSIMTARLSTDTKGKKVEHHSDLG